MKKSKQQTAGSHQGRRVQGMRTAGQEQSPTGARGAAKPEVVTFEVRPPSGGPGTKSTEVPLVQVKVTWPAGQAERPNPAAKAVLDAVVRLFSELTFGGKASPSS